MIIGAGIAGLAAAHKLAGKNCEVTILEANNQAGGRMATDYSLGFPFDKGASWIHGIINNPIAELVQNFQLRTAFTPFDSLLCFDSDKKIIPIEELNDFSNYFDGLCAQAKIFAEQQNHDISLLEALNALNKENHEKKNNLWQWCLTRKSLVTGSSVSHLSGRHWDEEILFDGGNYLMLEGYGPLIKKLSESSRILYNQTVKKINYQKSGVEVTTQNEIFNCDKVIITVSLGVLQKQIIEFDPVLPKLKLQAIKNLNMGLLNKIALKFPTQFWAPGQVGMYLPGKDITYFMDYSYFWTAPVLTAYVGGDEGEELEKFSDDSLVEMTMKQIKKYLGTHVPDPEKFLITRWGKNPFTYGSYSYIPVNASGKELDDLAMPVDKKVFFAGEATHRQHFASVHGAYLSGIREAERILALIST